MFDDVSVDSLIEEIGRSARAENVACARRLAAIAELYRRRVVMVEDSQGRERWRIDPWDAVVAEVAAAQSVTSGAADSLVHVATCLHLRLPRVAAVFATGTLDYRTVRLVVSRTLLAVEPEVLAAIDAELAETISAWSGLSKYRTQLAVDRLVERHDPEARRRTESRARSRHIDIRHDRHGSYLTGTLFGTDGTLLDQRLTAMAHAVCDNDPRTPDQRRADALGALAAGRTTLACACGSLECPCTESGSGASVVVHVVTEAATLEMARPTDVHGGRPEDDTCEVITSRDRLVEVLKSATTPRTAPARPPTPNPTTSGLVLGGSTISASVLADLAARGLAEFKQITHPGDAPPEPHYRPSASLADFVRCRDLTCRFPNCDHPADRCDLDHTIPYDAGGPTHASNLKALCRKHHLLKTFWCGPSGWRDAQLPDGTVIWTSPSGHTYRTNPGSKLLIPSLCAPTGTLNVTPRQRDSRWRSVMMPTRSRTRAQTRRSRVLAERRH